jgi:hypothetical protein
MARIDDILGGGSGDPPLPEDRLISDYQRAFIEPEDRSDSILGGLSESAKSFASWMGVVSLIGASAWVGHKYFPRSLRNKATKAVVDAAGKLPHSKGGAAGFFERANEYFKNRRRTYMDPASATDPGLYGRAAPRELNLLHELQVVKESVSAQGIYGGPFHEVINPILHRHRQDNLVSGQFAMHLGHLMADGGMPQAALNRLFGTEPMRNMRSIWAELTQMPGFTNQLRGIPELQRAVRNKPGLTFQQAFAESVRVGPGLGVTDAAKLGLDPGTLLPFDARSLTFAGAMERFSRMRFLDVPVLGTLLRPFSRLPVLSELAKLKPGELLLPTQLFAEQPVVAHLDKRFVKKLGQARGVPTDAFSGGIFAGGNILPISGRQFKTLGAPIAAGYRLGKMSSGMGLGHQARAELYKSTAVPYGPQEQPGWPHKLGQVSPILGKAAGWMSRQAGLLGQFAEKKLGFGTAFARSQSAFKEASAPLLNLANRRQFVPQRLDFFTHDPAKGWERFRQFGVGDVSSDEVFGAAAARFPRLTGGIRKLFGKMGRQPVLGYQHGAIGVAEGGIEAAMGIMPRATGWSREFFNPATGTKLPGGYLPGQWMSPAAAARVRQQNAAGLLSYKRGVAMGEFRGAPSGAGRFRSSPAQFYAFRTAGEGLGDFLNYQLTRPFWLMEKMTGMGLKPGRTWVGTLGRIIQLSGAVYGAGQAVQYADYKTRQLTAPIQRSAGIETPLGPIGLAATGVAGVDVGLRYAASALGVNAAADWMEAAVPGSVSSWGSSLVRAGVVGAAGTAISAMTGAGGLGLLATAGAAGLAAVDYTRDPGHVLEEYQGTRDVPVRAGRGWALGMDPYEGGRVKYWRPSWYRRLVTGASDVGRYGSEQNRWEMGTLPTPENLFGLRTLFDPYALENQNYGTRPYPVTGGLGEDIPLVGPVFGATIGQLIKPTQYREPDSLRPGRKEQLEAAALGFGGPSYMPGGPSGMEMQSAVSPTQIGADVAAKTSDWMGMTGFLSSSIKETLTGEKDFATGQAVLASSGQIGGISRWFYDLQLGGLAGQTELIRRFITKPRQVEQINPLRNTMPAWLPGEGSMFQGDADYYMNFHRGDPMGELPEGDIRLPGPGYRAMRGITQESPVDAYRILSDVAPFSQAHRYYRNIAEAQAAGGLLGKGQAEQIFRIGRQLDIRMESRSGTPLHYGGVQDEMTVSRVTGPSTFEVAELPGQGFRLAGVEGNPLLADRGALTSTRARLEGLVGQTVSMTYGGAGTYTPAIVGDINRSAIAAGAAMDMPTGLDVGAQAEPSAAFLGRRIEPLLHKQLPGPMDWLRTKWLVRRSPVEQYEQQVAYGTGHQDWASPYSSYLKPWATRALGIVPAATQRNREITEYMGHVQYLKYAKMAQSAQDAGHIRLSNQYRRAMSNTLPAVDPFGPRFQSQAFASAPDAERPYLHAFGGEMDPSVQRRILEASPEYMHPTYLGMWQRRMPRTTINSPVLSRYAERLQKEYSGRSDPSQEVAEYFSRYQAPDGDWAGWSPDADLEQLAVRMMDESWGDVNAAGYYPKEVRRARAAAARIPLPAATTTVAPIFDDVESTLRQSKMQILERRMTMGSNQTIIDIKRRRRRRRRDENRLVASGSFF